MITLRFLKFSNERAHETLDTRGFVNRLDFKPTIVFIHTLIQDWVFSCLPGSKRQLNYRVCFSS